MTVINSRSTKKGNDSELYGHQQIKKQIQCQGKNSLATENSIRQFWEEREKENIIGAGISGISRGWLSLLNWIGAFTLSLLLKLLPRKLKPWFVLWSYLLLRLLFISINLTYGHALSTVVMSGLVPLVAMWNN